ncbi:hypothetical protein JNM87_03525 [Candidatus Saccharibacteria bacterium]|nr:hypothetical protein [Candidatus Saccharibacteria bacterium]
MGILDNLRKIFDVTIKDNTVADNLREIKLIDFSNSGTKTTNKNKLEINLNGPIIVNVDPRDKSIAPKIQEVIRAAVHEEGAQILAENFNERLEGYSQYAAGRNPQLEDLVSQVKQEDANLLRAAYYLRTVHQSGGNVNELKRDIVERYGERGKNVTNLCSAGYFESIIYPMLQELRNQPHYSATIFQDRFDVIIMSYPFAVFVSQQSTTQTVAQEILQKIETNRKYGVHHLKIHAIGNSNARIAQEALDDGQIMKYLTKDPVINTVNNIFECEIIF